MVRSFADIDKMVERIKLGTPKVLSIAVADDEHVLQAVCQAKKLGIADAVLVGNKQAIIDKAGEHGFDLDGFEIIHRENASGAAETAVELVREGKAHILMKGLLDTSVFLKAVLDKEKGLRDSKLLSYASLFEVKGFNRLLIITDPAINLEPDLESKEIIMKNAVALAHALGNECPKVAFVCPVEKVNPKMDSTLHAKALVEKYSGSRGFCVGGPFGLDNAISEYAAKIKGVGGPVAGKADILILNDIGVGNAIYKSLIFFSNAVNAGIVSGAKAPILIPSRAENAEARLYCIKLGVLLADYYKSLNAYRKEA